MVTALTVVSRAADRVAAAWVSVQPGDYDPTSGRGPEWGKAAPAGLLIWLFMGVALFFLIKSMNRHMKRVPKSFDADQQPDSADRPDAPVDDGAGAPADEAGEPGMTLSSGRSDSEAD
jgi:hypothetical protein